MVTALITDSTCDIPAQLIEKYSIYVVPQHVIWGTEDLLDGHDLTADTFYQRLQQDSTHPKTSQPIAQEFLDFVEQAQADGADEAVIITLSKEMSGTNDSAVGAQAQAGIPVHVLDSRSVTMGLGWQVLAAARAREAGGDAQAMLDAANAVRQRSTVRFSVDTLEFLHRGGRIGGASRLIGTALNLKPELYVDHEAGKVEPGARTRTRSKALDKLYDSFFEKVGGEGPLHVAVLHGDAAEEAAQFEEKLNREHDPAELHVIPISPVIGVHTGPGTIALAGYRGD